MATGHYTKLVDGHLSVGMTEEKIKCISYPKFRKKIKEYYFPVGDLEKRQVRELAKELGVRVYAKKDSQEICFVEDGQLKQFLIEKQRGKCIIREISLTGMEKFLESITVCLLYHRTKKGLGISSESPLYVVELNSERNEIIVGNNEDLMREKLIAERCNLF